MAHIENFESLEIEEAAIDLLPESLARQHSILAVSVDRELLRIIVPLEENRRDTIEKVEWMLNRRVIVDTADREQINAAIEFYYSAHGARVKDCPPRFQFQCPQRWFNLSTTEDRNVRFCGECRRNVYLCRDADEWRLHAGQGHCVAILERFEDEHDYLLGALDLDYDGD